MDILYRPLRMVGLLSAGSEQAAPTDLAGYAQQYQKRQQQDGNHDKLEQRAADLARGVVYIEEIPQDLYGPAKNLLEKYSGIRGPQAFEEHVSRIRDKLWQKHAHANVGHFRFLALDFTSDPCYEIALVRLLDETKSGNAATAFLDVGCGLGQVLRQLALDGVNSNRLYGCDLEPDFIEAGYELFGDKARTKATFVTGDIMGDVAHNDIPQNNPANMSRYANAWDSPEYRIDAQPKHDNQAMEALNGKMDIIHASSLFHLFGWETQKKAAVRMVKLLKKDDPAVMIFGRHVGVSNRRNGSTASVVSPYSSTPNSPMSPARPPTSGTTGSAGTNGTSGSGQSYTLQGGDKRFLHDPRTWQRLWDEVGEATGTRWRTEVDWLGAPIQSMTDSSGAAVRRLRFAVFRSS